MSIDVGERVYAADADFPMAVVGTAGRGLIIYSLDGQPKEYKRVEPPLKFQHRCLSIFRDKKNQPTGIEMKRKKIRYWYHFKSKSGIFQTIGFALGSVEGRVAIQYANAPNPKDNFTFKCHRSNGINNGFQVSFVTILRHF